MTRDPASASGDENVQPDHAVFVCDADGRVVDASGDFGLLLGRPPPADYVELVALLSANPPAGAVPRLGQRGAVAVRGGEGRRELLLSSHPVSVPGRDGQATDLTVYVLAPSVAGGRDPAIDPGIASVLSHELRTPITTIYAGSQMLLRRSAMSEDSQREMLVDIQLEADRLYRLVEDLLVANVGQRGIEVVAEPLLLQRVLPRVVELEAARWPHVKFVTTLASELPAVRADELYVEHVVRDLLANAGSFSDEHGTVRLDARAGSDAVEVRVLDEGPGIDPADAQGLFRPFRGVTPEGGGRPGPGLGLYVCKLLVEAMGGRVWAGRRASGGSEFGFTLVPYREDSEEVRGERAAG